MNFLVDSPKGFVICYCAFDAGLRSRYERAYFPSLNLFGRAAKAGLPSFLTERASSFAPSNRLCQQQALSCDSDNLENGGCSISPRVAARRPGKASSYLYAMKGEARRRRLKCLAPYGIRADPHRESYRFLHRNKQLVQVDHV